MDLEDLRTFVEVAEAGGLTLASRRLGLSKSVVSRRLARLEAAMAAQLVSRTTRGVALTEAGAAFKTHAEQSLAALAAGREAVRQDGGPVTGRLRLTASLSFGATHLAPVLAELALRHPMLEIEASYSDRFADLIGERYDAAIRLGSLPDSSLVARRIAPVLAAVVASPAYLAQHGVPATPDELRAHATLDQSNEPWRFAKGRQAITVTLRPRFLADSGQALLAAVLAGVGIARLPTFLCGHAIGTGELRVLLPDFTLPEAGLFVVRPPPAGHTPAKVQALTDLMVERFGGEPYWDSCQKARQAKA
jgi:DNA-binding transcriptional LysR family regulator